MLGKANDDDVDGGKRLMIRLIPVIVCEILNLVSSRVFRLLTSPLHAQLLFFLVSLQPLINLMIIRFIK